MTKRSIGSRVSKIDELLSASGKDRLADFLMAIEARASIRSAAMVLGITANTLSTWISKGKKGDKPYREFYEKICVSLGHATMSAEIELSNNNPEWYLTRGPGKLVVGDLYSKNTEGVDYNLDGSVSPLGEGDLTLTDKTIEPLDAEENRQHKIDNQMSMEALLELREAGMSLDDMLDDMLNKHSGISMSNDDTTEIKGEEVEERVRHIR